MHSRPIQIRPALPADQPAIDAVMAAAFARVRQVYRPTPAAVHRAATATEVHRLVAIVDEAIIGVLRYSRQDHRLHLGLGVHPEHQHKGIARALVEALAQVARDTSATALSLYTVCETGNVPLFEKLGFTVVRVGPAEEIESPTGAALTEAYMERSLAS